MIVRNIIVCMVLMNLSIEDIRFRSVALYKIILAGVAAIIYRLLIGWISTFIVIFTMLFLLGLVIISCLTESIGLGDIAVLGILSCVLGGIFTIRAFMVAMLIMTASVTGRLLLKKIPLKKSVPFIPFLFVSVSGVFICG